MLKKNKEPLIALLFIAALCLYALNRKRNVADKGVYTIAKIDSYTPDADGSSTHISFSLNGKNYAAVIGSGTIEMVGRHYFIKVLKKTLLLL